MGFSSRLTSNGLDQAAALAGDTRYLSSKEYKKAAPVRAKLRAAAAWAK